MLMENSENYSKLCSDDLSTDGQLLYQDHKTVTDWSSPLRCRLIAVCLGLLSVLLLTVDIALGVHYRKIGSGQLELYHNFTQISSELKQLRIDHLIKVNVREQLVVKLEEASNRQHSDSLMEGTEYEWGAELQREIKNLLEEKTQLQSHISQLGEGCVQCPPGWYLLESMCYYFPFSDTMPQKGWTDSRNYCIKKAAELAVIDTWEKQEWISQMISEQYTSTPKHMSGFWIGLTDEHDEGTWTWTNGTELAHGYWEEGEPNNHYGVEDCAAVYPRVDSRENWNDAPCGHPLKWICEKAPGSST